MRYEWLKSTGRKEPTKNLEFRRKIGRQCQHDAVLRDAVRELCKHDMLFWLNTFGWTHDPRKVDDGTPILPFITYEFQDELLNEAERCLGKESLCVVKSRTMGATWCFLALLTHRWQFWHDLAFGCVSREERLVDGHPKSLFTKIDVLLNNQPKFLLPEYDHFHLRFWNKTTGSTIEGTSTTDQMFRGDRYTAIFWDEAAAMESVPSQKAWAACQQASPCRFLCSTPQGTNGAFHDIAHNQDMKRMDLHWSRHPVYSLNSYTTESGKVRSPWYDKQCRELVVPAMIAQELDLDFAGSSSPFFKADLLDRLLKVECRPPLARGRLVFDENFPLDRERISFVSDDKGWLLLWMPLKTDFKGGLTPLDGQYVLGADVSMGSGASNSAFGGAERVSREKVLEVARSDLSPDKFADLGLALAAWLGEAFLIWELNGPGTKFGKQVIERGYRNIYYRKDELSLEGRESKGMIPGWFSSPNNKLLLMTSYASALESGSFLNRSREAIQECKSYVYLPNGTIGNAKAQANADLSGAKVNHGDRVIADALANKALGSAPQLVVREDDVEQTPENPPYGSLAWRRKEWQEEQRIRESGGWESNKDSLGGWREMPSIVSMWD